MGVGSFLAGLFLGGHCTSRTVTHSHHTTSIRIPVQYPADWDDYSDENKLEWLKNRRYWFEYYELKNSLHERVQVKLVEGGDGIYSKVIDSIIKNRGDETEAKQLFFEYLNEKFVGKVLNETTSMKFAMEMDRMKDYIQANYPLIAQFSKPVEDYCFNITTIRM